MMMIGLAQDSKQAKQMSKLVQKMKLPLIDELDTVIDDRSIEEIHEQGAKIDLESQPGFEALNSFFSKM